MSDQSRQSPRADPRVQAALGEYLERIDRGEVVNREEFLSRHLEIADALRSFFSAEEPLRKIAATKMSNESAAISTQSIAAQGQETVLPKLQPAGSLGTAGGGLAGKFGRYEILRALGKGAMGAVYLAQDTQLKRQVAIKTPHLEEDPTGELLKRFYREAEAAATLRHANICPVHDVGQIDGKHFISMAYIEGRPLSDLIKSGKLQNERHILIAVYKLARALQQAHDRGIVHRDLKPANIMVDKQGEPMIMDFGLARKRRAEGEASLTQSGVILGSPAYMSPEQIEGDPESVGPASDQYSLGVVLYEMLTGQLPFRGSVVNVLAQIITKGPTPPGELRPGLDPRIEAVCLRMMAKHASDRFPSMKAVADQLAAIVKNPAATPASAPAPAPAPVPAPVPVAAEPSPTASRPAGVPRAMSADAGASQIGQSLNQRSISQRSISPSDVTSIEVLVRECLRRRDYDQMIQIIERIPEDRRNAALQTLLEQAREKVDEIAFLICEINEADRLGEKQTALRKAEDLLKIKPGHQRAQQIQQKYSGHTVGAAVRIGPLSQFTKPWNEGGWIPWSVLALGLAGCAVLLGVMIIYLGKTAIVIDVRDSSVKVAVDRSNIAITGPNRETVTVEPGEHELKITYRGLDIVSKSFSLKRGDTKTVTVSLVDEKLVAKLVNEVIAEQDLKQPAHANVTPREAIVAKSLPQTLPPIESGAAELKEHVSESDPLRAGSVWTGSFTFSKGWWEGDTVDYEVHVERREGATFDGFRFGGRAGNRLPVKGEVHGKKVSWRDGDEWQIEGTIAGDAIQLQFKGEFGRGRTEGDGLLRRAAKATHPTAEDNTRGLADRRSQPTARPNNGFVPLFNGKDLTGWQGDPRIWAVEEGSIVAHGDRNPASDWKGNTYLVHQGDYTDFELKLQFKLSKGNSGVQFRSVLNDNGTMHGYQAEIGFDRAGKDLTGSLQEETGRSFLATLDDYERNQFEATYYRLGDWNDLLIRCEGDHIVIEINGYRSVDFHDHEGRRSGFIALQSHGRMKPLIEFRKIEIKELPAQNAATSNAAAGSEGYQLYERRTYTVYPGKMADLDRRFHEHTFRLFEKHGMKVIAYSIRTDKPGTLEYMLAHSNREAADKCWKEFAADPEWKRVVKETEKNGPLVKTVEHSFLTASDYRATESPAGAATPLPDANEKAGRIFLAENQNKARVKTRPSGLQYLILVDGKGKKPAASDVVTVHYKGMLLDGKVFDDATVRPAPPKSLPLSQVIPGWREALQLMKVGSVWRVFVPPNLAYGSRGTDNGAIGPNETLIFEIELVKIEHLR